jgi:pimeloyl-ACP methyl ester carboxylesterase
MSLHYIDLPDAQLEVEVRGTSGPPVLFVHGFPMNRHIWDEITADMSQDHIYILPDLRLFGGSVSKSDRLTFDILSRDIADVLTGLDIQAAHVVGISLGGMVAMHFAAHYGHRVTSLTLMHAEATAESDVDKVRRNTMIAEIEAGGREAFIDGFAPRLFGAHKDPKAIAQLTAIMRATSDKGILAGLRLLRDRPDLSQFVADVRARTLVVAGGQDQSSPVELLANLASSLPDGHLHVIETAGHMSVMETPEHVGRLLKGWISRDYPVV